MSGKAPLDGYALGAQVANHKFIVLETGEMSSLNAFRAGRPMVLDFWHTKCVKCPEALTKLDRMAASGTYPGVLFAACAVSLGTEATDQGNTAEMVEGEWENLQHVYMEVGQKEIAKAEYPFSAVPFCVVFGADGAVLAKGDPKGIDFAAAFEAQPAKPLGEANRDMPKQVLTLDEDF